MFDNFKDDTEGHQENMRLSGQGTGFLVHPSERVRFVFVETEHFS